MTVPAHHLDIRVSPHGLRRLRLQLGHLIDQGTQRGKPILRSFGIEVELFVSPDMASTDVEAVSCATALQAQTVHRFYHVGVNICRVDGTRRVSFVGAISRSCHIYRERRTPAHQLNAGPFKGGETTVDDYISVMVSNQVSDTSLIRGLLV